MTESVRRLVALAFVVTTHWLSLFIMLSDDPVASPFGETLALGGASSCIVLALAGSRLTLAQSILATLGGGLSLAIIGGVGLALTPIGLERTTAAAWTLTVSAVATTVWWWRGFPVPSARVPQQGSRRITGLSLAVLLVAAIIAITASLVSIAGGRTAEAMPVIQAWVLREEESPDGPAFIGLREGTGLQATCTIELGDGRGALLIWRGVRLEKGRTWLGRLDDPPGVPDGSLEIDVSCRTESNGSVVRTLRIDAGDA